MKNSLKALTLLLFSLISNSSFAQSRVNPEKTLIIGEFKSWILGQNVLGWDFHNETWKSRSGYLRVGDGSGFIDIVEDYNGKVDESKSRTYQNFNEIGILNITFEDTTYIGLGVEEIEGSYTYPEISQDWNYSSHYYIFVFEKEELSKLKTINGQIQLTPILGTNSYPTIRSEKFQGCYENVKFSFSKKNIEKSNYDPDWKLFVKKTNSESKEVIRFILPQNFNRYRFESVDFDNHYFEIPIEKFNELLLLL